MTNQVPSVHMVFHPYGRRQRRGNKVETGPDPSVRIGHLEFTATPHLSQPARHVEDLLVLYLGSGQAVEDVLTRLDVTPVSSANPWWDRIGVTVLDPDGFRVVLVAETWTV